MKSVGKPTAEAEATREASFGKDDTPGNDQAKEASTISLYRQCSRSFWITGYPHLTRRWPFGRVTEGLPTNHSELLGELAEHLAE